MASIDTGSHGGKKSVDQEIPLIPFIDLLLCCVMFLLVTAVWNQLGELSVNQATPGDTDIQLPEPMQELTLRVAVTSAGFEVSSSDGARSEVPRVGGDLDHAGLQEQLGAFRTAGPERPVILAPDDGVQHLELIETMDTVMGSGFAEVRFGA